MTSLSGTGCPLCDLPNQQVEVSDHGVRMHFKCKRCGDGRITNTAVSILKTRGLAHLFSAWLRGRKERKASTVEISTSNLDDLASALPKYSVLEKQALLLRWAAEQSQFPGATVELEAEFDYPISWCKTEIELTYHVESLKRRHLIEVFESPHKETTASEIVITPDGWTYLELESRPRTANDQGFIAMAFAEEMRPAWKGGIEKAIARAGYRPFRTDGQPSIDRIDMQIMAEIRRSSFVIADVTLQRPGVYFEAGYALGLGIPVYWCVREDELEKVHFDTRQYNHITWRTPEDLEVTLFNFIYAISGPASAA
jgi:nucleoside 2-deoxyribosyltransferase